MSSRTWSPLFTTSSFLHGKLCQPLSAISMSWEKLRRVCVCRADLGVRGFPSPFLTLMVLEV